MCYAYEVGVSCVYTCTMDMENKMKKPQHQHLAIKTKRQQEIRNKPPINKIQKNKKIINKTEHITLNTIANLI